ncbi:MAG: hypothetical protein GX891_03510 [Clostridiales bacterium]|nr:hypothetical protein [Clostridiales bacterium]
MIEKLFPKPLATAILSSYGKEEITEIRLRVGKPVVIHLMDRREYLHRGVSCYMATQSDIDRVVAVASGFSVYAANDELVRGFMHFESGVRIGACGYGTVEKGSVLSLKTITSLAIRIPHEVKGCADSFFEKIDKSALIVSPPGCGKTTMLRELARLSSDKLTTLIIDERFEIAGVGISLDVGNCDVISGVPKTVAYENTIRAMNPELIVTDELFRQEDVAAVLDIMRSGVRVYASVHAKDLSSLEASAVFSPLLKEVGAAVVLTDKPRVGTVKEVRFA